MPSGGQIGSGVKIWYAATSPTVWVQIPEVREVGQLPNRERDKVETTVHGTTSERTNIPGLAEVSDLEFTLRANLDAGSAHIALKNFEASQVTKWFRVEVPVDADLATSNYVAYTFQGRVSKWDLQAPIDDLKEIEVTVQYEGSLMFQEEMTGVS